jgi:hypothetical protein
MAVEEFLSFEAYFPAPAPADSKEVSAYVERELRRLAGVLGGATYIQLRAINSAPPRVFEGMTVLADGTNFDPGGGQGVYTYYGGVWNKLG